jgi:hypothetical protein
LIVRLASGIVNDFTARLGVRETRKRPLRPAA